MRKSLIFSICVIIFLMGSVFLPATEADRLNIGTKVSEGDFPVYTFSSGVIVKTESIYIDYIPLILDGNASTGINNDFKTNENSMSFQLIFPYSLYVTNVTIKPNFGGAFSKYSFSIVASYGSINIDQNQEIGTERTYQINCLLKGIYMHIFDKNLGSGNETGYYCFNDVIINYTPSPETLNKPKQTSPQIFNIGKKNSESDLGYWGEYKYYYYNSENVLWGRKDYLDYIPPIFDGNESTGLKRFFGKDYGALDVWLIFPDPIFINNITIKPTFGGNKSKYSIGLNYRDTDITLNWKNDEEKTYKLNSLIDTLWLTIFEEKVFEGNGTGYYFFNDIILNYIPYLSHNYYKDNDNYNISHIQNQINILNMNINSINNDISNLQKDITELKESIKNIKNNNVSTYNDSALQDQINNLSQELTSLKENLSELENKFNSNQNNSGLKGRVVNLEAENLILNQKIGNLTLRINNLTTELEKLASEVRNIQGISDDESDGSEKDFRIADYTYPAVFGIIIIILLLIILKLSLTVLKRRHHEAEEPSSDDILISKLKYDIMTNKEIKDSRLYDDEYKRLLENGYRNGDMSPETYNYIKSVLEVTENPQEIKDDKT